MDFNNDEDIMKAINAGGGADIDLDDELAALEAEVGGGKKKEKKKKKEGDDLSLSDLSEEEEEEKKPQKKHEKHASDDDLDALEKEGLDDLEEEEKPKPKPEIKPQPKPQPQPKKQAPPPQPQKKPEPQINKEELAKAMQAKQSQKSNSGIDLYPEKVEKKYHDVQKMTSLGVLEKEKEICDKIIEYKKKRDEDPDTWDFKKESLNDRIGIITSTIQDGAWDFEMYKKKIKEQYAWESKLLVFLEKDPSLNPEQKNILKERINNRKKIIEEELTRNPDEEAEEEEKQSPPPKEEEKKPESQPKQNPAPEKPTNATSDAKGGDFYPEKVEAKYHAVNKMDSLGVLEKEKEICDLIIGYKKKKGEDYDTWEFKKDSIDTRKDTITSSIENGIVNFEMYKKKIKSQYEWETKLLLFVEKDKTLNDAQKKIIKERVNKRKKIIEEELTQNPDEQAEKEEPEEEPVKEEPKKQEVIKKKEEIKKSLSPMYTVPKGQEDEECKRLTQVVTDRLNEYRAAIDYFKSNQLSEQQAKAIKCAKAICIELKRIQDGKWKEVNEFALPDPVTPELIYGYSKEERMEKFKKIIKELTEQKKGITNDYNARIESFKKLTKVQFKKIEAVAKKDLDALKSKKEKLEKIIKILLEKAQDKWVPAPLYIETEEETQVPKINADIPENTIRIIFGKTTYVKKDKLYLIVTVPEKKLGRTINQSHPGDWTEEFDWKVEKADFKSFWKTKIHVDIYEKKTLLKDKLRGHFEMEPKGLKDHLECTDNYKIDLESKREGQTANVTFKVRTPCKEPLFTTQTKKVFQVTTIYPAFNINGGPIKETAVKIESNQQKVTADDLKVNNPVAPKPSAPKPAPKAQKAPTPVAQAKQGGGAPTKKPGPPKAHIDKSEFKDEELKDPDCIDCLNTLQVLEFKLNKYEEERNKIDGRTPRELMQKIIKIKCKHQSLTDALGDEIGPQDYLTLLKTTFAHDKKLADYFNQIKDTQKSKLVSERLPLIIKETEELMKQMPK